MKVLVTGGAGFIGSNFILRALSNSRDIAITVLDSLTYASNLANLQAVESKIFFVEGSINDEALVSELVESTDYVVHFAAESHNDNSLLAPKLFYETNLMGTMVLANACLQHGKRLHHISTDEVFGDTEIDSKEEFTKTSPYNPSSPYSASKAAGDHLIRAWTRSFGLLATISNCSNNYGPQQHWEKLIPATIKAILDGNRPKVFGDGLNIRDWIHVDDHSDGILLCLEKGRVGETYLLGARDRQSNLAVVSAILTAMGKSKDDFEFVRDRAGHDRRYAVDPAFAESQLGWRAQRGGLLDEVPILVEHYSKKWKAAP